MLAFQRDIARTHLPPFVPANSWRPWVDFFRNSDNAYALACHEASQHDLQLPARTNRTYPQCTDEELRFQRWVRDINRFRSRDMSFFVANIGLFGDFPADSSYLAQVSSTPEQHPNDLHSLPRSSTTRLPTQVISSSSFTPRQVLPCSLNIRRH